MRSSASCPTGPKYIIRPPVWSSTSTSKERKMAADGWWMVHRTARCALATPRMHFITTRAAEPSRPDVGSLQFRFQLASALHRHLNKS